jgi:hypothetical protein
MVFKKLLGGLFKSKADRDAERLLPALEAV